MAERSIHPPRPRAVRREIKILRLFMHPHIIRLYEVVETPTDIFVVRHPISSAVRSLPHTMPFCPPTRAPACDSAAPGALPKPILPSLSVMSPLLNDGSSALSLTSPPPPHSSPSPPRSQSPR